MDPDRSTRPAPRRRLRHPRVRPQLATHPPGRQLFRHLRRPVAAPPPLVPRHRGAVLPGMAPHRGGRAGLAPAPARTAGHRHLPHLGVGHVGDRRRPLADLLRHRHPTPRDHGRRHPGRPRRPPPEARAPSRPDPARPPRRHGCDRRGDVRRHRRRRRLLSRWPGAVRDRHRGGRGRMCALRIVAGPEQSCARRDRQALLRAVPLALAGSGVPDRRASRPPTAQHRRWSASPSCSG